MAGPSDDGCGQVLYSTSLSSSRSSHNDRRITTESIEPVLRGQTDIRAGVHSTLPYRRHLWLRRHALILNVNVPFNREKNSALMNAAMPAQREVVAPATMRAAIPADKSTVAKHVA